jgi:hypothetical protein
MEAKGSMKIGIVVGANQSHMQMATKGESTSDLQESGIKQSLKYATPLPDQKWLTARTQGKS